MEYLDVCDETGAPTGATVERGPAHRTGTLHRTAHVWIVRQHNGKTQVLLQKRSRASASYPGMFDTSSAGHIGAGEEPLPSAARELREELGIDAAPEDLTFCGHFRIRNDTAFYGKPYRDNEYVFVYLYDRPVRTGELTLQPEEVETAEWFDLDEVSDRCARGDPLFCVPEGGLAVLRTFLAARLDEHGTA